MKLKDFLKKEGINQTEFANLVGISRFHANRLANAKILPSCKLLKKIDEVTKGEVTLHDFFQLDFLDDENPKPKNT